MTRDLDVWSYLLQMFSPRHTSKRHNYSQCEFMIIHRKMLPTAVGLDTMLNCDMKCTITYFVLKLLGSGLNTWGFRITCSSVDWGIIDFFKLIT